MIVDQVIAQIEAEWKFADGFFWKARLGEFDAIGFDRTISALQSIELGAIDSIPARLVSLIWYMPQFLGWQIDRLCDNGVSLERIQGAIAGLNNEIERILGTP